MQRDRYVGVNSRERMLAWEILRDSPTMRMAALVGGPWWRPEVPSTQSWLARVIEAIRKAAGLMSGRRS
jgi:hypothetical protein